MIKRFTILFLAFVLIFFGSNVSLAEENLLVTLQEPNETVFVKGEEVVYRLNINFERPLEDYQTMHITFRFSEGLDYVSSSFVGVDAVKDRVDITTNPNDEGRHGFLTVKVSDTSELEGQSDFSVNIRAKINDALDDGSHLLNRIIVSYQLKDQVSSSQAEYYNIEQESTAQVFKTAPVEQILFTKTGNIYAEFVTEIEGKTNPGNTLQARYLDQVEPIAVDGNGNFRFRVPSGLQSNITISSLDENGNIYKSETLRFVDESSINQSDLEGVMSSLREFGYGETVDKMYSEFQSEMQRLEFLMGIEGGTVQEMYNFFKRLYDATKTGLSQTSIHEAFMNGYPDGKFLPGNSITRAETAAILSRIIANGEVTERNSTFSDVPRGQWYTKYIAHLLEEGIMKGYDDGLFRPQNKITRAEFATIVSRINRLNSTELITFPDLKENYWAHDDIIKVATAGIMEGYPDGTFGVTNNVTRAEAATIINRMLNRIPDENYIKENNITGFSDIKNHWAYLQIVEATYKHEFVRNGNQEIYK